MSHYLFHFIANDLTWDYGRHVRYAVVCIQPQLYVLVSVKVFRGSIKMKL